MEYGISSEISPDNETSVIRKLSARKFNAVLLSGLGDVRKKSEFVNAIVKGFPNTVVAVLMYTSLCEDCRKFISAGAERCIIMPQSVASICSCVMNMMNDTGLYLQETADFIAGYGFPQNMNGFYYFCSATEVRIMNHSERVSEIYRIVAERFSTTPEIVESSIRHFIKVSYNKGAVKNFSDGYDFRPSNHELIYSVSEAMSEFYDILKDGKLIEKNKFNKIRMLVYSSHNMLMNPKSVVK